MVRAVEHVVGGADLLDAPEVHHRDAVGEVAHHAHVVGDEDVARLLLGLQVGEQVQDRRLYGDVERARRLVAHHDARVTGERPGDGDALLQPARQLRRLQVEVARGEPQMGGQGLDPVVRRRAGDAGELAHAAQQDATHRPGSVECRVGVLEHHLHRALVVGRAARCRGRDDLPVERHGTARVGRFDPEHRLGQRRLAGTGLADDAERLALGEPQFDIDECRDRRAALVEGLRHVGELEHLRRGRRGGEDADRHGRLHVDQFADAVGVMAAGHMAEAGARGDDRRDLVATAVVGERAAIEEHTRGERAADDRQRAGDGGERLLGLAHAVPG